MSHRVLLCGLVLALSVAVPAAAQSNAQIQTILDRLERLEHENESLRKEVQALRNELHPPAGPGIEERLEVQESHSAEQAQTKVEASQRFPLRLTGMALANTFINSKQNGG